MSAWLTCAAAWWWCYAERDYARYRVFARWSWPRAAAQWQLLALGIPIGAVFFVDVTAFTFMALFIARFGAVYSGAHQIAANLTALAFMLPLAIGNAGSVLVGQAIGAREPLRARATGIAAIAVSLGCGLAVGAAIFLAAGPIVRLYTADPDVQRLAVGLLAFVAVYHVFDAVQAAAVQILRGYKRAAVPMVIYGVALWGIALGGGYALGIGGVRRRGADEGDRFLAGRGGRNGADRGAGQRLLPAREPRAVVLGRPAFVLGRPGFVLGREDLGRERPVPGRAAFARSAASSALRAQGAISSRDSIASSGARQ